MKQEYLKINPWENVCLSFPAVSCVYFSLYISFYVVLAKDRSTAYIVSMPGPLGSQTSKEKTLKSSVGELHDLNIRTHTYIEIDVMDIRLKEAFTISSYDSSHTVM